MARALCFRARSLALLLYAILVVIARQRVNSVHFRRGSSISKRLRLFQSVGVDTASAGVSSLSSDANTCEPCGPAQPKQLDCPTFLVDPLSDPTLEELTNQNLIKIVNLETSDEQCNALCWKCLGYRLNPEDSTYSNDKVFPKWREKFPIPPDVIGLSRNYDPSVDKLVRDASMALMRSIPRDFKGGVRNLEKDGFRGFKLSELTPNKTRRAQLVNWLIYYREKLFGKTLEDLQRERMEQIQNEIESDSNMKGVDPNLPSERMFEKHRLDDANTSI